MPRKPVLPPALDQMFTDEVRLIPLMDRQEEVRTAKLARKGDIAAYRALIAANLRFVQKTAHKYDGYGMDFNELVQEGNIGLCQAASKFDPDKGFRLISYAVWFIEAAMRAYVLRNWSLVKTGTTGLQKRLFFKLRSEYAKAMHASGENETAARALLQGVFGDNVAEIEMMGARLAGRDVSLQARLDWTPGESFGGEETTFQDQLEASAAPADEQFAAEESRQALAEAIDEVYESLGSREKIIFSRRFLRVDPETRTATGRAVGLSRERVRQLELGMREKLDETFRRYRAQGRI